MEKISSIDQLLDEMSRRWIPEKAAGVRAAIQLDLSGADARQTCFIINDGALAVQPGATENPNLTLTASADDYISISNGEIDAVKAFMQGRLKAKGDLGLALKFQSMFDFERE